MAFVKAAEAAAIPSGEGIVVEVEGKKIALFNCDGNYFATDNTCVHRGGPLGEGLVEGTTVICPRHGWEFDVSSGACLTNRKARIGVYPTKVEGEDLLVDVSAGS
ncbi:MAG: Rieske (2Fe-2S) protein [Deltaproteobacteria bacterium]|nr:Rieske (2Fe-2S) protein [Deltaproteobacteria bacterium]